MPNRRLLMGPLLVVAAAATWHSGAAAQSQDARWSRFSNRQAASAKPATKVTPVPTAHHRPTPKLAATDAQQRATLQAALDTQQKRIEQQRVELEALRTTLDQSGVLPPPAKAGPGLSEAQQEKRRELEVELQKVNEQLDQLQQAIKGGLPETTVAASKHELTERRREIETELQRLVRIDEQPATTSPAPLLSRVASQETALAMLNARIDTLPKAPMPPSVPEPTRKANVGHGQPLPIEFFAFADFYYEWRQSGDDGFRVGQLEIDLDQELNRHVHVAVAVAYDSESEGFGLGAFAVDLGLAGKETRHLVQTGTLEASGVVLGQFDVPFGIAYMEYPSVDNPLVTQPHVVGATHDGWNDLGAQLYLDAGWTNATAFVVNGFGYETENDAGETLEHPTDAAVGGRFGVRPVEQLELGGSVAAGLEGADANVFLGGADLLLEAAGLDLRGEYIFMQRGGVTDGITTHGFFGQARYDIASTFLVGRYSAVQDDDTDLTNQLNLGVGFKVLEFSELRFEYATELDAQENSVFVQVVGGTGWTPTGLRR